MLCFIFVERNVYQIELQEKIAKEVREESREEMKARN
jgi:hypothetical protein